MSLIYDLIQEINFENEIIRPLNYLNCLTKAYPDISANVNIMIQAKKDQKLDWADWCFIPFQGWHTYVCSSQRLPFKNLVAARESAIVAALGTWRYSQGIYHINEHLIESLMDSPISGNIPSEVILRFPEFCSYVEIPDSVEFLIFNDTRVYGFWAMLEHCVKENKAELRITLDTSAVLMTIPISIGAWSVDEAIQRMSINVNSAIDEMGYQAPKINDASMKRNADIANKLLPIILYLCSDCPDIEPSKQPTRCNTIVSKTKKGWRLFPANKPKIIDVGASIGEKLKQHPPKHYGIGRPVRAHLRRGHWHGYWRGARTLDVRQFNYKWIPPMIVAGLEENID